MQYARQIHLFAPRLHQAEQRSVTGFLAERQLESTVAKTNELRQKFCYPGGDLEIV